MLGSCFKSVIAVLSETFNGFESLDLMLDVSVETSLAEPMTALIEDLHLFLICVDATNLANLHIDIHDGIRLFDSLQRLFLSDILWLLKRGNLGSFLLFLVYYLVALVIILGHSRLIIIITLSLKSI